MAVYSTSQLAARTSAYAGSKEEASDAPRPQAVGPLLRFTLEPSVNEKRGQLHSVQPAFHQGGGGEGEWERQAATEADFVPLIGVTDPVEICNHKPTHSSFYFNIFYYLLVGSFFQLNTTLTGVGC